MLLILFSIFFVNYILGNSGIKFSPASSIFKNNKLYVYEAEDSRVNWSSLSIYEFKNSKVSDIQGKVYNVTNIDSWGHTPQFLQFPKGSQNEKSDGIFMIGGKTERIIETNELDSAKWNWKLVNDHEFGFDSNLVSLPEYENFPKGGFSQTIVNINNSPIMYVLGGFIYSKELKNQMLTNYFFKYDFSTNKWSDLSDTTKKAIIPMAFHTSIQHENSLMVFGGLSHGPNTNSIQTAPSTNTTLFNPLEMVYKFDLVTEKWVRFKTKINKEKKFYGNGAVVGASFDVYDGNIISYICLANKDTQKFDPQLGILDRNNWEWKWYPVLNDAGVDNNLVLQFHQSVIINDQLILFHGVTNQKQSKKIYVIDINEKKFKGELNISGSNGNSSTQALPIYIIIIVVVVCIIAIVLLIASIWLYSRYGKRDKSTSKSVEKMQEVWVAHTIEKNCYVSEDGNIQFHTMNDGSVAFGNTATYNALTSNVLSDEYISNLGCFQHEVDLQDMTEINSPKLNTNS